jgi:3-oxoacyl-[acyl-carrier protein] reductase
MDLGLKGKVALVAGSSTGLGRAVAGALAAEGTSLVICARGEERLAGARDEIVEEHGVAVEAVTADLTRPADVNRLVDGAVERFGRVDVLFTNTGGPPAGPFEEQGPEAWDLAVRQNLHSVVNLVRAVLPGMRERGWGRIVNCTSVAVKQPIDGLMLSNSIRAAVTGFARTLANEVASDGITVNNVLPGFTRTERLVHLAEHNARDRGTSVEEAYAAWESEIPAGRLGEPRELGALVAFLASDQAAYITAQSICVDGGWVKGLL